EILSDVAPAVEELLRDDVTLGDTAREALKEGSARSLLSDLADVARHSNADGFEGATSREGLSELGRRHGVKGKALFQPIRLAVTGTEHGIELPLLLPLLGPARVASRIASALSQDS
ncbi:MAG: hypothetical protein ACHQY2_07380, partial [Candidatus Eremiobacterales bacterium]